MFRDGKPYSSPGLPWPFDVSTIANHGIWVFDAYIFKGH